jgi:hypothetical protein
MNLFFNYSFKGFKSVWSGYALCPNTFRMRENMIRRNNIIRSSTATTVRSYFHGFGKDLDIVRIYGWPIKISFYFAC